MAMQVNVKQDFSEVMDYMIPQYPVYIRSAFLSQYHNYTAVSHWHEDVEIIYVLSGTMQYDVNGENITLYENEGIVVNSRNFHFGYSDKKEECGFICFIIHPSVLSGNPYIRERYVRPFTECQAIPFLHLRPDKKWQNELLEVLWTVFHLNQDAPEFYLLCQEAVFRIFTLLYTNNMELLSEKSDKADISLIQLRKMVGYIQKHYQDSIMLDDIAKIGEMGKTACCNIFKKYMNTSPIDYVITYRLAQSTVLLTETRLPITEIAYGSGFHNASYYTKYFRKQYGKTPGQMRKEYLKQGLNVGRADGSFQNSRAEAAVQHS